MIEQLTDDFTLTRQLDPQWAGEPTRRWNESRTRFLTSIDPSQREAVDGLLQHIHNGGAGIRSWLDAITWRGSPLPESLPSELIDVYLRDSEAAPLHDCEDCGLAIPIRANRRHAEGDADRVYFAACPACGGRTGPYAYWSRRADHGSETYLKKLQRRRPR